MNKLTNIDIRGIYRGACQKSQCECTEYICKSDSATESVLLCLYCGHPPINHASMLDISNTGMYIHIFSLLRTLKIVLGLTKNKTQSVVDVNVG